MGVNGLWEIVKPASTVEDLTVYFIREGFEDKGKGRFYRLGIDASLWFHQVQSTFAVGHAQSGENPELRTLFYRLERLLRLPVHAVFVFDGPERPSTKRGTRVVPTGHWMVNAMKEIINAFGYVFYTAPAEAEAELALFNQLGHIDGILTDDSDAFLFGAKTVIRNYTAKDSTIVITTSRLVEENKNVALTCPSLIFIALLTGGDYNNGLPGFGKRVAHGLARYGFGVTLRDAYWGRGGVRLVDFLPGWREEIRHVLCTDKGGHLGRRYARLSQQIPDSWPDIDVLADYINPVTSSPEDLEYSWPHPPDIVRLGQLCERYFSWGTRAGISRHFASCLVPGVVTRILIFRALNQDRIREGKGVGLYQDNFEALLCIQFDPPRASLDIREGPKKSRVAVTDAGFHLLGGSTLYGSRPDDDGAAQKEVSTSPVWVHPYLLLRATGIDGGSDHEAGNSATKASTSLTKPSHFATRSHSSANTGHPATSTRRSLSSAADVTSFAVRVTSSTARATSSTARATSSTARATSSTARATLSTARATLSTAHATSSTAHVNSSTARANSSTARANSSTARANSSAAHVNAFATHANSPAACAISSATRANASAAHANSPTARANSSAARANSSATRANVFAAHVSSSTARANSPAACANSSTARANLSAARAISSAARANSSTARAISSAARANSSATRSDSPAACSISSATRANASAAHANSPTACANSSAAHVNSSTTHANLPAACTNSSATRANSPTARANLPAARANSSATHANSHYGHMGLFTANGESLAARVSSSTSKETGDIIDLTLSDEEASVRLLYEHRGSEVIEISSDEDM